MSPPLELARLTWPASSVGDALIALAEKSGIALAADLQRTEAVPCDDESLRVFGVSLGLELGQVQSSWRGALSLVRSGPLLAPLADGRWLALLPARRGKARVLCSDLTVVERSAKDLRELVPNPLVRKELAEIDGALEALAVPPRRRPRAGELLLDQRLGLRPAAVAWLVRAATSGTVASQLHEVGFFSSLKKLAAALVLQYTLASLSWLFLAWGALSGRVDPGWLVAWAIALGTQVPLRGALLSLAGRIALTGGAVVKRLLLFGALRGDLDTMRAQGLGGLIGRAIESEAFESLALNGGLRLLVGAFELVVALVVASQGAGGGWLVALGLGMLALTTLGGLRYLRAKDTWTRARMGLTGDLIERMVGHRTRLAQEPPSEWHRGEDATLADYVRRSTPPDDLESALAVWPRRGFLALGLLVVALAAGTAPDPLAIGLGLGGLLLGAQALDGLANGVAAIAGAVVARRMVADLLTSARRPERIGAILPTAPTPDTHTAPTGPPSAVLDLTRVGFAYPSRPRAVLDDVHLRIHAGDRVLLEGGSGSGKSTLAAIIAGLRLPTRGLALLHGLDPATWGERAWRTRAVAAPQFHDNRVIAGTFAFNLLLGRGGMPEPKALAEAEAICRELGLGPLLERMPAGLFQQVGESGWQLSHGERSRLYLARALLQDADIVLLDESFGALDPESQGKALTCALNRAKTLVVIAHP